MKVGETCKHGVVYVESTASVLDAARKMRTFHVGNLVVIDPESAPGKRPVGILTDRDIAVGIVAKAPEYLENLRVEEVMTGDLVTISESEDIWTAVKRMREHGVRRLPVTNPRDSLVGIISLDDIVGLLAEQLTDLSVVVKRQTDAEHKLRP